ncbi:hypothetical protein LTR84_012973 [Exophiala bonariae]|uniref:F-box domain-containing protein n=1 Tax=Exophiala bonariae TaxID=1690606 RepID=A0AAV9NH97_9EURO|nr:hypothetical protein LTR84_012973 [Exophiala bonariae]
MTLRNPERLFIQDVDDFDDDDTENSPLQHIAQIAFNQMAFVTGNHPPRSASQPPTRTPQTPNKTAIQIPDYPDVVHPVFTDFGPETLGQYVRREIKNLRSQTNSASSKAKGKGRAQPQTSPSKQPRVSKLAKAPSTVSGGLRSKLLSASLAFPSFGKSQTEPPQLATSSDEAGPIQQDESGETATSSDAGVQKRLQDSTNSFPEVNTISVSSPRRSSRLAVKGTSLGGDPTLSSRITENPTGSDGPRSSLLLTNDSRTSGFEAHTKSKREAVRAANVDSASIFEETDDRFDDRTNQARLRKSASRSNDVFFPISLEEDSTQSQSGSSQPGLALSDDAQISGVRDCIPETLPPYLSSTVTPRSTTSAAKWAPPAFDYSQIVPESIPKSVIKTFSDSGRKQKPRQTGAAAELRGGLDAHTTSTTGTTSSADTGTNEGDGKEKIVRPTMEIYPRVLPQTSLLSIMGPQTRPPQLQSAGKGKSSASALSQTTPSDSLERFNADLWLNVTKYLSTRDVGNLRLVNTRVCQSLSSIQFRNVVINFDKQFFDNNGGNWNGRSGDLPPNSMFEKHGDNLNQFGIAFEYDLVGLSNAKAKVIEKEEDAWFGKFTWPTEQYPRFPELQQIEDLVDHNRPLLKEAFKFITKASELGLCIDSGHGWLEGPDISDMALMSRRATRGGKIFGKTFRGEDILDKLCRNEYFKWAQKNTINEAIKYVMQTRSPSKTATLTELQSLQSIPIRELESFRFQHEQHDFDEKSHVGGTPTTAAHGMGNPNVLNWAAHFNPAAQNPAPHHPRMLGNVANRRAPPPTKPQWPLIFNGHNIAAEMGGQCAFIQNRTFLPAAASLRPCALTEAQAQWLMETVWAQRAFLSSYTTAIITNKTNFKHIHTLRITKLSSGLLPSLEQKEFWTSLPSLQKLQMLISPDWRQEHLTGDRFHQTNMPIPPHKAAQRFTEFLRMYVVRVESLHSLTVGYVGGGEHAVGMFARNQHVLPAPIVSSPAGWLLGNEKPKKRAALTKFEHIRDLKFENCWFSPKMLEEFMVQSRDTSLHSLTLDSVSLLTKHDSSLDASLTTSASNLQCNHEKEDWLQEQIPHGATWTRVLDKITPGVTLLDRKYAVGLIDETMHPKPPKPFRGNIQKIILSSCGYVKITLPKNITPTVFNQYSAVIHLLSPMDLGIRTRRDRFNKGGNQSSEIHELAALGAFAPPNLGRRQDQPDIGLNRTVMNTASPEGETYPWLGTLTQCVHPIEKRVLEMAWKLEFGWPGNLERWAAVEDGFFEGGTGRFSGTIDKDTPLQDPTTGNAGDEDTSASADPTAAADAYAPTA